MKQLSHLFALLLGLALLAGCAAPGAPAAETAAPFARHTPAPQDATPAPETPAPAATPEPTPTPEPAPTPQPGAVSVRSTHSYEGGGEKMLFEGLDAAGNVVWQHTATTEYSTELTLIEEIGVWNDRFYFTRQGIVSCLRLSDGFLLWENGEFGGASISSLIDKRSGNVYLCGWYGPDFYACDKNGETLSRFASASGDFFWPSDMSWYGPDSLVIYWNGGAGTEMALPYFVDLTDYSISWDYGFEDMSANRQYWANIFISDFVEQFKSNFPEDEGSDYELASFAHMFCKINRRDALSYDGNYDTFSLDTVNELCSRFFGREIHPANGVLYTNPWGMEWTYQNGSFRFPSGDGEAYNRFAVVTSYLRLADGNVLLGYEIYELKLEEYFSSGMDGKLYYLTGEQARSMAETGRITCLGYGNAFVTPIEQNGRDGYFMRKMDSHFYGY